jgi:hypothetical protein
MKLKLFKLLFPKFYYEYLNLKTYSEFSKFCEDNKEKLPSPTIVYASVCCDWLLSLMISKDKINNKQRYINDSSYGSKLIDQNKKIVSLYDQDNNKHF